MTKSNKILLPSVVTWSLSKKSWVMILTSLLIYFLRFEVYHMFAWPPYSIPTVVILIFDVPYILDFIVVISTCFYIINFKFRQQILNDYWKCFSPTLISIAGEFSNTEIVILMENIRLLHDEISQLLKTFDLGHGSLLLGYFGCSFIDMIYLFNLMINHEFN